MFLARRVYLAAVIGSAAVFLSLPMMWAISRQTQDTVTIPLLAPSVVFQDSDLFLDVPDLLPSVEWTSGGMGFLPWVHDSVSNRKHVHIQYWHVMGLAVILPVHAFYGWCRRRRQIHGFTVISADPAAPGDPAGGATESLGSG